jgi:hypothetical protein
MESLDILRKHTSGWSLFRKKVFVTSSVNVTDPGKTMARNLGMIKINKPNGVDLINFGLFEVSWQH